MLINVIGRREGERMRESSGAWDGKTD